MSGDSAVVQCTHSVVEVLCTDGERRTVSTCQLGDDDINGDGEVEWPPRGECRGPTLEARYGTTTSEERLDDIQEHARALEDDIDGLAGQQIAREIRLKAEQLSGNV